MYEDHTSGSVSDKLKKVTEMKIQIEEPLTSEDFERYYDLRWRILREPWNQPRGSERDDREDRSTHIIARIEDKIIAVGRVHFNSDVEAQVRYMAVESKHQGRGFGSLLLKELEKKAREKGAKYIVLNARENATAFYEKNGYKKIDKAPTLFGRVEHWKMLKDLG